MLSTFQIEISFHEGGSMNLKRAWTFVVIVLLAGAAPLRADEAVQIPKDGWWARYFVTAQTERGNDYTEKRTYSLVGTTTENSEKCRWVEIESDSQIGGRHESYVMKFLIPEKELLENEKPLDGLVRAWRKNNDGPVEEMRFNQPLGGNGAVGSADFYFGRDLNIFPGPQQKSKSTPKGKVVDFQQGRLEINEGRVGKSVASRRAITTGQKQEYVAEFTSWSHPSIGPVSAAHHQRVEFRRDEKLVQSSTEELLLEDFGNDAKSKLPENQ